MKQTILALVMFVTAAVAETNSVTPLVAKEGDTFKVHLPLFTETNSWRGPTVTQHLVWVTNYLTHLPTNSADVVRYMGIEGHTTNVVKLLVESGKVCEVIEHKWKYYPNYLDQQTLKLLCNVRVCEVCGKIQSKKEVWE